MEPSVAMLSKKFIDKNFNRIKNFDKRDLIQISNDPKKCGSKNWVKKCFGPKQFRVQKTFWHKKL